MKSYTNLFGLITNKGNIRAAMNEAAKHKKKLHSVRRALNNIDSLVDLLSDVLKQKKWQPPKVHRTKEINDGVTLKKRHIVCPEFVSEQTIHHAVLRVIMPLYTKKFYRYSCGSIPGRGREMAIRFIRKEIQDKKKTKYFCKLDIHHFFDSIRPSKVFHELRKTIHDKDTLLILSQMLRNNRTERGKFGVPIGFFSSPFFANVLLNPLDHIIKDGLGVNVYVRYMDDMLLFHGNKRELKAISERIVEYLASVSLNLKCEVQIHKLEGNAVGFVGYTIFRDKIKLRSGIFLRACRTARRTAAKKHKTAYDAARVLSYAGQFEYADSYNAFNGKITSQVNLWECKHLISKKARKQNGMAKVGK